MKIYFKIIFGVISGVISGIYRWGIQNNHMAGYILFHLVCVFQLAFFITGNPNEIVTEELFSMIITVYGLVMLLASPLYYEKLMSMKCSGKDIYEE